MKNIINLNEVELEVSLGGVGNTFEVVIPPSHLVCNMLQSIEDTLWGAFKVRQETSNVFDESFMDKVLVEVWDDDFYQIDYSLPGLAGLEEVAKQVRDSIIADYLKEKGELK